jgi:hypothetical protein
MPRTLYSPRLSDDVIRSLYREGKRRRMPMTRLADELILAALAIPQHSTEQATSEKPAESSAALFIPGKLAA